MLFGAGASIKWLAIAPVRWTQFPAALKQSVTGFLRGFVCVFVVSTAIFILGAWASASRYNLEPPLVAMALGLVVSNVFRVPEWLKPALRVEFYVKVGIVLLGATLPLTLLTWAGPVALGQASIISLVTFFVIFGVARVLGIDKRFAAVLGVGGAVCGVSASTC